MPQIEIPWNATVHRRSDLAGHEIDGEMVMADIQSGRFYGLGNSARRIWDLLAQPQSMETLCDELGKEFEVEPEQCREDVSAFLSDLNKAGLIRIE